MIRWREEIINKFKNNINRIVMVYDIDYILNDDSILYELKQIGYGVIRFENSISFRFLLEKEYRPKLDDNNMLI